MPKWISTYSEYNERYKELPHFLCLPQRKHFIAIREYKDSFQSDLIFLDIVGDDSEIYFSDSVDVAALKLIYPELFAVQ